MDDQVCNALMVVYKKTCQYCLRVFEEGSLQIDHVDPVALGGSDSLLNLTLACERCNQRKSDLRLEEPGRSLLLTIAKSKVNDILALLNGLPRESCIGFLRTVSIGELAKSDVDERLKDWD